MKRTPFPVVCVVGLGTAGSALAARIAAGGRRVLGVEASAAALERGRRRVEAALPGPARGQVEYSTGSAAFPRADLVIEAVPERLADKLAVFGAAHRACRADAVFATTTAGFAVTEIAAGSGRMTRTVGWHPGHPGSGAPVELVEIVHTPLTDASVGADLGRFAADLGLTGVTVKDQPGLLAAGLVLAYLNSAAAMVEEGYASHDDIDTAMTLGCGLPVGPLAHLDALGIDVVADSLAALAERTGDRVYRPAPVLVRMAAAGAHGRKAGHGFYRYDRPAPPAPDFAAEPGTARPVRRVGLVGSGTMASGIAEACAAAGLPVTLVARTDVRAKEAAVAVERSLDRRVRRGRLTAGEAGAVAARLVTTTDFDALRGCDLVVEAVSEDLTSKAEVFARAAAATAPGTVLATTTSSLPVARCAAAKTRPEDVIGLHFFNPAPAMRLVEVVPSVRTSTETTATALGFVHALGKHPVRCGDRTGFIVNALLLPHLNRAVHVVVSRFADSDDLDTALVHGYGHPVGPLRLLDLIGLDVSLAILDRLHEAFGDPGLLPADVHVRLVAAGHLGRKSGRGFRVHEPAHAGAGLS